MPAVGTGSDAGNGEEQWAWLGARISVGSMELTQEVTSA